MRPYFRDSGSTTGLQRMHCLRGASGILPPGSLKPCGPCGRLSRTTIRRHRSAKFSSVATAALGLSPCHCSTRASCLRRCAGCSMGIRRQSWCMSLRLWASPDRIREEKFIRSWRRISCGSGSAVVLERWRVRRAIKMAMYSLPTWRPNEFLRWI